MEINERTGIQLGGRVGWLLLLGFLARQRRRQHLFEERKENPRHGVESSGMPTMEAHGAPRIIITQAPMQLEFYA